MVAIGLGVVAFVVVRSSATSIELVAMGDSYSAGVGLGEVTKADCDRDDDAYGPQAARLVDAVEIDAVEFVACSGAVTANFFDEQRIRFLRDDDIFVPPQLDSVSDDTDIVTLTIGGNDIDFGGKVVSCLIGSCGERMLELDPSSRDDPLLTWELLSQRLTERYLDIRRAMAPDGFLFVLSYPIPFEIADAALDSCVGFEANEMLAGNALSTTLGDTIEEAAELANDELADEDLPGNVVFVDWRVGERIDGGYLAPSGAEHDYYDTPNGICSGEPYLNGFDPRTLVSGDATNNFHPTAAGYDFAAEELAAAIDDAFD